MSDSSNPAPSALRGSLTPRTLRRLRRGGVAEHVIDDLQTRVPHYGRNVYVYGRNGKIRIRYRETP